MNIGTLQIEIAANVARLQRDMDEAKRSVSGAMKDVERVVGVAKSAFIGLAGVASVGTFAGIVSGAIQAKAQLADMSLQTGISVEALSVLRDVANYSDTPLSDVAAASNKLSKALYEQNEDSKGAAQALRALGIDFQQFKSLQPDEQMQRVATAMAGFNDGAGKAATAMLLFGKAGAQLLPFLNEMAERQGTLARETTASAKAAKEYEDNLTTLRITGDEWKKQLANEMLPVLLQFTNQLLDAKKAYGSLFGALATGQPLTASNPGQALKGVRAEMETLQKDLDAIVARQGTAGKDGAKGFLARALGDTDKTLFSAYSERLLVLRQRKEFLESQQAREALELGDGITDRNSARKRNLDVTAPAAAGKAKAERDDYTPLIKAIREKAAEQRAEFDGLGKLSEAQRLEAKLIADIDGGYIKLTAAQRRQVEDALDMLRVMGELNAEREAELKWLKESGDENVRRAEALAQSRDAAQQQAQDAEEQLRLYGLTADEVRALEAAKLRDAAATLRQRAALADGAWLDDIARLYREQADALDRTADARARLADREANERRDPAAGAGRAVKEYLADVQRAGDATYGAVRNSMASLEDALTSAFSKGKLDARSFIDTVIAEFVRLRVVKPLMASIFEGGNFFGSLFGGGGGGLLGGLFGGFLAEGGQAIAGKTYVVGERGPELFTPRSSGTVTPNSQIGAGKQVSITYAPQISIDSRSDAAAVRRETEAVVAAGHRQLVEMLHARGVV